MAQCCLTLAQGSDASKEAALEQMGDMLRDGACAGVAWAGTRADTLTIIPSAPALSRPSRRGARIAR